MTEYEVLTPVGACLLKTPDLEIARAFVRERTRKVAGLSLRIESVSTTVIRQRVPLRPALKIVAA